MTEVNNVPHMMRPVAGMSGHACSVSPSKRSAKTKFKATVTPLSGVVRLNGARL